MNRPKFCVGEEVATNNDRVTESKYQSHHTEITHAKYLEEGALKSIDNKPSNAGWFYKAAHTGLSIWWSEESLMKLPYKWKQTFNELMANIQEQA
ncbi:MAG: hypothetical protein OXE99_06060 [Cellvibrionales bacterium]|nr:hypothetical protein [Cellvibrionales bacterium]